MTPTFGKLCTKADVERDAIHIATLPVTADESLEPGQPVNFTRNDNNNFVGAVSREDCVGIVDPFLDGTVLKGERFWLFLLPNTVTSLKHQWTHPGIDKRLELLEKMMYGDSKQRLRDFAHDIGVSYEELISRAQDYQETGEYWSEGGRFEGVGIYDGFWQDYQRATGGEIKEDENGFFSCSC